MTLKEWCEKYGIHPTTTETGAVSLTQWLQGKGIWELYSLSDYAVSSVSGIVTWLVPRKIPNNDGDSQQKTWTELLGKCNPTTDSVSGNSIVRREGNNHKVLWSFETEKEAREAYHWWWWGK